ncbi:hypothetical protein [Pseudomonas syringae group genomosp. 3]|uniref:Uncharacterized protein n=1 Tax=Pseudomonas syringae pv. viburni TaxID=251703 RepID=A0A0Q0K4J9_9PSED|nr:hypothetical protein [Pseudomonas syringae group genomosp. 3]KPZ21530.1 hypothetical protein ALO40_03907 [Pseudomonas syringae pv. viburni]
MSIVNREYSAFARANKPALAALQALLESTDDPSRYSDTMLDLGRILGAQLSSVIPVSEKCLVASTAEDADFLTRGIYDCLKIKHLTKAAVFWNNHYSVAGGSIAPVVHKFLEPGYQAANVLVIAKAVISGSCVVRTNILELIEDLSVSSIYIVAPVMHSKSEQNLRDEFPEEIADKFVFIYLAVDSEKTFSGEVVPGIGGQIYGLLGMKDQPARVSYMPQLVKQLAAL